VNRVTVTATSQGAGGVVSSIEHVLALPSPPEPSVEYPVYLPVLSA
jgi:hypothetical protein